MNYKKVIKYSFITLLPSVVYNLEINLVIYQIKENNFIKQTISELVIYARRNE